ncbi:MAG: exopolysaccharide Pel transporter PelG, partial [Candidatus Rifleibacteriota bacterium]
MAGIGFRLQKLVDHGSYTYSLRGFFFATFLVAGPWITTITIISLFSWFTTISGHDYDVFRTSIIYFYAFSLILTGLYQMPLTRYLADELYDEKLDRLVPAYLAMMLIVSLSQGLFATAYASIIPLSLFYKALFVSGTVTVALLWLAGIFLSCLRDFEYIGYIYIIGGLVSLAAGIHLEPFWGLEGALTGFLAGQVFTFIGISWRIIAELGVGDMRADFKCLGSLRQYKTHLFAGLFFNLAIWIDKFIFWLSDLGQTAVYGLYYFQPYDVPIFIAYVFMIPGLGIFLTRVETDFYRSYRAFYRSILTRRNFRSIVTRFEDIGRTINYTT